MDKQAATSTVQSCINVEVASHSHPHLILIMPPHGFSQCIRVRSGWDFKGLAEETKNRN